jgi:iron complex outermembrane receptor protein
MVIKLSLQKSILSGAFFVLISTEALAGVTDTNSPQKSSDALENLSLEQLVNVRVTSVSKKETDAFTSPAAITVITQDDIQRNGFTSIPDALRMVPGMDVAQINADEWAVSTRGFNAQFGRDLLVLIDGRCVYTPSSAGVYWSAQDVVMEDLDRIEVIRGPGASLWGANAVDGVINIISKSAKDTQGLLVSSSGGNLDQDSATVRYGGELASNLYYRVYAKRFDDSAFSDTTGNSTMDAWNSTQAGFRTDWEPPSGNFLTLQGDYYYSEASNPLQLASLAPPITSVVNDDEHNQGGNVLGRWTRTFSDSAQLSLQTYFDHVEQQNSYGNLHQNTYDVDLQDRFALGSRNDVVWGAGYRYQVVQDTPSFELTWNPEIADIRLFNIFAQDDITLVRDRLHVILGSKFENNSLVGWEIQPNGRLLWTPAENQSVWAAVSRATRTPSLFELDSRLNPAAFPTGPTSPPGLVSVFGNPDADAEQLTAYQLGYRVAPTKNLSFDFTGFYNVYDDLLIPVANPTVLESSPPPTHLLFSSTYENAGAGDTYGVELSSQWRVMENWTLAASYSWLATQMTAPTAAFEGRSPSQQFQIRSYIDLPYHLKLNGAIYFVDRTLSPTSAGTEAIPAYARVDLGLIWSPRKWLEIGIWGQNLQQSEHVEFSSQPSPLLTEVPRSVLAKVTMRF